MSEHEVFKPIHKYIAVDLKYSEDEELLKFNAIHDMVIIYTLKLNRMLMEL